jgi:hypothetical protein
MSTINRPITVKDLRQQFQQQSTFNINNPSEEYIFQQRQSPSKSTTTTNRSSRANENWSNESIVKVIPTPRSFDTFGISSDEEEEEEEENKSDIKQEKPEIEKTLVKRRYDSEYASSNTTITSTEQDDINTHKQSPSKKRQPISTGRVRR